MTDWHVGQKVVCVNDTWNVARLIGLGESKPVAGRVYTIRKILVVSDGVGFLLDEIVNVPRLYTEGIFEHGFFAFRFRPVTTKSTDISIFRRLVEPSELEKFREKVEA